MRLLLVAAGALVDVLGRVLLCQRPAGKSMAGLWEFPGGKVEPNESPEMCLVRELHEELGIEVAHTSLVALGFASHAYGPDAGNFHLLMPLYGCREWRGECRAIEAGALAWVKPGQLRDYPMPPADAPLIAHVLKFAE